MAARSESAAASARWPTSAGVACPSRKWVPSTIASTDVTASASPRTTAASSPIQRTTRLLSRRASAAPIASISARSFKGPSATSPVAIDDPGAVEVVRRDLDAHPVPRQDPDAEAPHLPGDVAEHLVAVVELHPEHRVRERLDDLAFEFDLLFLGQKLDDLDVRGLRALGGLAELVLDLRAFRQRAESLTRDTREVHERILPPVIGGDEPEALLVAEPLDDTSCHTTPPHCLTRCARGAAWHCLPACFRPPSWRTRPPGLYQRDMKRARSAGRRDRPAALAGVLRRL